MPMVKDRLRRAMEMSAPSLAMPRRRLSGRTALFFVAFIGFHKMDLKWFKVHFKIPYWNNISENLVWLCALLVSHYRPLCFISLYCDTCQQNSRPSTPVKSVSLQRSASACGSPACAED